MSWNLSGWLHIVKTVLFSMPYSLWMLLYPLGFVPCRVSPQNGNCLQARTQILRFISPNSLHLTYQKGKGQQEKTEYYT